MAAFYGLNFNKARTAPPTFVDHGEYGGRVRVMYDEYTVPAAAGPGIGDTIAFARLPKGARILDGYVNNTAGAASSTLALGDAAVSNRLLAATGMQSAAHTRFSAATGIGYLTPASVDVIGTVAGAGLQANQVIRVAVVYVTD